MLFNSIDFLIFFPAVVLLYLLIPAKLRQIWLLICSYFFYMCWDPRYILLLVLSTVITFISGLLLEKRTDSSVRKVVLAGCLTANLGLLFVFKYLGFSLEIWEAVTGMQLRAPGFVLPVGISFYTFQALGYTIDCYRGRIPAEKNFIHYALFVSFFPQLVAGPIERSGNLISQIHALLERKRSELLDFDRIRGGFILMAYGMFLKLVIADRIAVLVDTVYGHYYLYGTVGLLMAAAGFGIQIYCDFGGYSIIALGAARILGIRLMENFQAPYLAVSIRDFWRRWHISLSSWFRDYVYIPLGGNRRGRIRKAVNTMITFTLSGLWHGANWTFLVWGAIHGILLVAEDLLRAPVRKLHRALEVRTGTWGFRLCRAAVVTAVVDLAWIFFRAPSIRDACGYILRMFTHADWWILSGDKIYSYGLDAMQLHILAIGLLVLALADLIRVKRGLMPDEWLARQYAPFRVLAVLFLVLFTVVYGQYGPGFDSREFIYFQF